ncbi:MAG: InlB B-repeat-containing protein, partial [Clostridiales bacterium]|nr:InlB B-repeat-containing protein [Clostridiales bacterium]
VSIENATWTLVVSNGRADFTLEIEGGYIGLRAPTAESYEELAYAEMPASDDRAFIAGNFTNDFKLYKEWSNDSALIITAKVEKDDNTYYVFQGVKLNKHDEYKIVLGSAQSSVQYVETSGTYNIVYNATDNTVAVYVSKELTATQKEGATIYVGKKPTADDLTVTYGGETVTDYIIRAAVATAAGENTATIVYLDGGAITLLTYTATADSIKTVEITTKPATLGYYVGDTLDFTDIVLKVIYNSGDELIASWTGNNDLDGNARITLEIAEEYYADGGFVKAGADIPVTVKFDGIEATTNVEINVYNKLTSIVITDPTTTEYVSGVSEELDYTGLVVTAYYNNTTEADGENAVKATISLKSEENENGYTIDATAYVYDVTGDYDITVSLTEVFGTLTSTANGKFTVSVVAPKVVSVAAADGSALTKTTQLIGSAFDANGLKFVGTKNDKDSTEVEISAADMTFEITVGGEIATNAAGLLVKSGTATVTATYTVDGEELTATFETAVTFEIANRLTSIEATQPDKTAFPQNGTFDKTGMTVTAKYNEGIDGATEATDTIDLEDCTVTANLATVGESAGVITVSYAENGITVTTTVNVEVTEPKVVSVTVTNISQLTKKKYYVGDTFAPAGLKFRATYDNGTIKADIGAAAFTFNGGNAFATASATANSTVVSIVYAADESVVVTGTVNVTVYDKLTSIVVTTQPTAPHTAGWVVGDKLDATTLKEVVITAYYNNTTDISKIVTDYTTNAADIDMSTVGTKTITVTYKETGVSELTETCTIEIEVIAKVMVALEYEGEVIEQYKNRAFDPDGLTFVKVYNNDARENIVGTTGITFTATNNWIIGGTFRKSGENAPVSANYTEDGKSFAVALQNVTVVDNTEYKVTYVGNNGDYAVKDLPKADYYQFESTLSTPTVPVSYGFTFAGWYTEAACTNAWIFSDNIPDGGEASQVLEDTTLYAKWTANRYMVSMEDENGESVGDPFNYTATNNVFTPRALAVPTTTKPGHSFKGWTYYDLADPTEEYIFTELTQARLLPEYSSKSGSSYSIVLKPFYEKDKFTVTFDSNGGSAIADQSIEYESNAIKPETDPTKTYYTFAGWYTTAALDTEFDFANTKITEATTVYAKWTAVEYNVTYSFKDEHGASVDGDAGDNPATYNADQGNVALKPATTTADGKVFIQWENAEGDKVIALSTSLIKNGKIELTAVFGEATVYTVSFDSNGGSSVADQSVIEGDTAVKPADPTYYGYRLAYWYLDDENEAFDFENTPITDDITLTAKWTVKNFTVSFNSDGGTSVAPLPVQDGTYATKPS